MTLSCVVCCVVCCVSVESMEDPDWLQQHEADLWRRRSQWNGSHSLLMELACSPCVCVGFVRMFRVSLHQQNASRQFRWLTNTWPTPGSRLPASHKGCTLLPTRRWVKCSQWIVFYISDSFLSFPFSSFLFFSSLSFPFQVSKITSIRLAHFKGMVAEFSLPNILEQKISIYPWKYFFKKKSLFEICVDSLMNFVSYASVSWLTCVLGLFFKYSVSCSPHLLCTVIRRGTTRGVQLAISHTPSSLRSASHYTQCFGSLADGCAL